MKCTAMDSGDNKPLDRLFINRYAMDMSKLRGGNEGKAAEFMEWTSRYEIGIPVIDEQHKTLVALCRRLHESALTTDRNGQRESMVAALKECVAYVATHFATEESLMRSAGFEGLAAHKARHDEFSRSVLDTAKELEACRFTGARKFVMFLRDWILSHISYEDRLFAPSVAKWLSEHGDYVI